MVDQVQQMLQQFKTALSQGNLDLASTKLSTLKAQLLDFDSLPPLGASTPTATQERQLAREIFEYAVILSVKQGDKDNFQKCIAQLRPYYTGYDATESDMKYTVIGLNLLYLLVENRLSDFHSELELYADAVMHHPYITFCTQLEQHLMVGSYDQVMEAAKRPPVEYYPFFLNSLLETVRVNIADCAVASYRTLTLQAAKKILMFSTLDEARDFIEDKYPELLIVNDVIDLRSQKTSKSEEIPSMKLISQTLAYAAELERIV